MPLHRPLPIASLSCHRIYPVPSFSASFVLFSTCTHAYAQYFLQFGLHLRPPYLTLPMRVTPIPITSLVKLMCSRDPPGQSTSTSHEPNTHRTMQCRRRYGIARLSPAFSVLCSLFPVSSSYASCVQVSLFKYCFHIKLHLLHNSQLFICPFTSRARAHLPRGGRLALISFTMLALTLHHTPQPANGRGVHLRPRAVGTRGSDVRCGCFDSFCAHLICLACIMLRLVLSSRTLCCLSYVPAVRLSTFCIIFISNRLSVQLMKSQSLLHRCLL